MARNSAAKRSASPSSVEIVVTKPNTNEQNQLHLINCTLDQDGVNANVSQYFSSQLQFENNQNDCAHLKASFRGRPLNGKCVRLPEKFTFARVQASENETQLLANDLTNTVTYWNLDKIPSANDPIPKFVQWLNLSADIHSHIQLDETE